MTTYYVSNAGSDAAAGTVGVPWQTLNRVNTQRVSPGFSPGDSILLNRGDTWAERLYIVDHDGASGNPITYGAYGTGALPIITGSGTRDSCVRMYNTEYINVQDMDLRSATSYGLWMDSTGGGCFHINVNRMLSSLNTRHGFNCDGYPGFNVLDDVTFTDCIAHRNGEAGYVVYQAEIATTGTTFYRCKATYSGQSAASHGFSSFDSTKIYFTECEGSYTNIDYITGLPNAFTTEGFGFAFDDYANASVMKYCYAHDNQGIGIQASHQGDNNTIYRCVSVNNGSAGYGGGIFVNGSSASSDNVWIYNNTVSNNVYSGINCESGPVTNVVIKNNIITNNSVWGISYGASSVTGSTVDKNLIYGNGSGGTVNVSGATNTITTDPMFTASGSIYTLLAGSPAIDAGLDLGSPYHLALSPSSIWPDAVATIDQTGTSWEIGAYGYSPTTAYPPTSTVSSGSWTPTGSATLYGAIDETVVDDADYDSSGVSPTADAMEVAFTVTDPGSNNLHFVTYRIKADGGCNATLTLRQGTTTIKQWTHTPAPSSWTTYEQPLTSTEAGTITNYSQLRLLIQAN